MPSTETIILRLLLSALAGGLIGLEREYHNKSAGLRTLILISVGSCIFTLLSFALATNDTDRIASNIVTGIGFLGAGVIFKSENGVKGLTTAAGIWVTAALGMAVGNGHYILTAVGVVLVFLTLNTLHYLESWLAKINDIRDYRITGEYHPGIWESHEALFKAHGLRIKRIKQTLVGNTFTGNWRATGPEKKHGQFIEAVLKEKSIKEFDF